MKKVQFSCAALGASGYSEASRNYIAAMNLYPKDLNLAVKSVNFERWVTDQSAYMSILNPLLKKKIEPDVQIIHMTPENYRVHRRPGVKNIGYTVWETTRLPEGWADMCNQLDEIWVPCDWNIEVFKNCGVKVPVKKIEHTINMGQFDNATDIDLGMPKDKFIFYSIFQWTERKNPAGLIRAYMSEFSKKDNVVLILKTYFQNNSEADKKSVEQEVRNIMNTMWVKEDHPPVILYHKMLSRQQILALHKSGHCLVLPHKAEGWSCTHFEAMAMGKPAIGTRFGGNTEFMTDDNSFLLDYQLTPVAGMPWGLYSGKGMWAEPSLEQLKAHMRYVYENYDAAKEKAAKGREDVKRYSWENIGKKIVDTLEA